MGEWGEILVIPPAVLPGPQKSGQVTILTSLRGIFFYTSTALFSHTEESFWTDVVSYVYS